MIDDVIWWKCVDKKIYDEFVYYKVWCRVFWFWEFVVMFCLIMWFV